MAWYDLGSDVNIQYGGLFFNPQDVEYAEVMDLDSGFGVDGAVLVGLGMGHIDEQRVEAGAHLLGEGPSALLSAFQEWTANGEQFNRLSAPAKYNFLRAALAVHSYAGMDGHVESQKLVIDSSYEQSVERAVEIAEEWGALEYKVTDDIDATIWDILNSWGIGREGEVDLRKGSPLPSRKDWMPRKKP